MRQIKDKDTKPEIKVRSELHKLGLRFRLNGRISKKIVPKGVLPGKPDIVLKKYNLVIFVHGCFWHHHDNCKRANKPKTNKKYWNSKLQKNIERDKANYKKIKSLGLKIIVIWECEINSKYFMFTLKERLNAIIDSR